MKIQEQDFYHGAALTQIVEHKSFKALNRASGKYGHYLINTDRHVFVKYRTAESSPWSFTFQADEVATISKSIVSGLTHVCLVCGGVTICALSSVEVQTLIDLNSSTSQWIKVEVPKGGRCHVAGSIGALAKTVPHNAFPDKVFA